MIKQYIELLKDPITFLRTEKETNYLRLLIFFLVPFLILFLSEIILTIMLRYEMSASSLAFILIFMVVTTLMLTMFIFAYSGICHVGALFFKKKIRFINSFKSAIFGIVNSFYYLFVLMIIGFLSLWWFDNINNTVYQIFNMVLVVFGMTHAIVVQILGVMSHHKLKQKHAVISVVASVFASLIVLVLFIFIISYAMQYTASPEFVMVN